MSKRKPRPLYFHDGFLLRLVKNLADGSELLYCDKRQPIGCTASAKRVNGVITLKSGHVGHEADNNLASAKLARYTIREMAATTTCTPKQLLKEVQSTLGPFPLSYSGSHDSLSKMIYRARQSKVENQSSSSGVNQNKVEEMAHELEFDPTSIQEALNQHVKQEVDDVQDTWPEPEATPNEGGRKVEELKKALEFDPTSIETTIQEALNQHVKQEVEDGQGTWLEPEATPNLDQVITVPVGNFFEAMREIIKDTVKESNNETVREIKSAISNQKLATNNRNQNTDETSEGVISSLKDYFMSLKNLATHLNSYELNQRVNTAIHNFENNKQSINVEQLLDKTLKCLEK